MKLCTVPTDKRDKCYVSINDWQHDLDAALKEYLPGGIRDELKISKGDINGQTNFSTVILSSNNVRTFFSNSLDFLEEAPKYEKLQLMKTLSNSNSISRDFSG